jgi:hypothetical protein
MERKDTLSRRQALYILAAYAAGACVPRQYQGASETGEYNQDALLGLTEIPQQPRLDQRIGVVCVNGVYPRSAGVNFFEYNIDVASRLGFQTTEIALVQQEFERHTGLSTGGRVTLDQLVARPDVEYVFSHPGLKNILVTTEVSGQGTFNAWDLNDPDACTPEKLQRTHQEYYRFASELLTRYGDSDKEIMVLGTNEIDWKALGGTDVSPTSTDLSDRAIANTKAYLDAYITAIKAANRDHPDKKPLKCAVEINRVRDIWDGKRRVLNAVIPNLEVQPDMVTYSAYDTLDQGTLFLEALDTIKHYAPGSEIIISEFGKPENRIDGQLMGREGVSELYRQRIQECLDRGVKFFMVWQLFDNECGGVVNPDNDQCQGFWMVRPDGSLSDNYRVIRDSFVEG